MRKIEITLPTSSNSSKARAKPAPKHNDLQCQSKGSKTTGLLAAGNGEKSKKADQEGSKRSASDSSDSDDAEFRPEKKKGKTLVIDDSDSSG